MLTNSQFRRQSLMPCHKAFIAHSPSQLNIFISNLDENLRGIFIKFKDNKRVGIDDTLGELIKNPKEQSELDEI